MTFVVEAGEKALDFAEDVVEGAIEFVVDAVEEVWELIEDLGEDLWNKVEDIFKDVITEEIWQVNVIPIVDNYDSSIEDELQLLQATLGNIDLIDLQIYNNTYSIGYFKNIRRILKDTSNSITYPRSSLYVNSPRIENIENAVAAYALANISNKAHLLNHTYTDYSGFTVTNVELLSVTTTTTQSIDDYIINSAVSTFDFDPTTFLLSKGPYVLWELLVNTVVLATRSVTIKVSTTDPETSIVTETYDTFTAPPINDAFPGIINITANVSVAHNTNNDTHTFNFAINYNLGSHTYPELYQTFVSIYPKHFRFMPWLPLRIDNTNYHEPVTSVTADVNNVLGVYGINGAAIINQFESNPEYKAEYLDHLLLNFTVDIESTDQNRLRYLFIFFDHLGVFTVNVDDPNHPRLTTEDTIRDFYRYQIDILPGEHPFNAYNGNILINRYHNDDYFVLYQWGNIERTEYPLANDTELENLFNAQTKPVMWHSRIDNADTIYYYQVSETKIVRLAIHDLHALYLVKDHASQQSRIITYYPTHESSLYVPLNLDIIEGFFSYQQRRHLLIQTVNLMAFYAHFEQHEEWNWAKILAVVYFAFTFDPNAFTMAALESFVVNLVIVHIIIEISIQAFGPEVGAIIATLLLIETGYIDTSAPVGLNQATIQNANHAVNVISKAGTAYLEEETSDFAETVFAFQNDLATWLDDVAEIREILRLDRYGRPISLLDEVYTTQFSGMDPEMYLAITTDPMLILELSTDPSLVIDTQFG